MESGNTLLTRCEICKTDCKTMAGLVVHVHKFHPPQPTAADLRETTLDLSDDTPHTEAAANGLRHTEWRRAGDRQRGGRGVEPW